MFFFRKGKIMIIIKIKILIGIFKILVVFVEYFSVSPISCSVSVNNYNYCNNGQ